MVKRPVPSWCRKRERHPRDARHAEANEVSFLLRDRL